MSNIGIDVTRVSSTQEFQLGARFQVNDDDGTKEYIYGRANGAVTGEGYLCSEATAGDWALVTTTTTAPGAYGHRTRCGGAAAALADNEYGWFQLYGKAPLLALASAAKGTRLNSTATGGAVDDDGTASAEVINGLTLGTAT